MKKLLLSLILILSVTTCFCLPAYAHSNNPPDSPCLPHLTVTCPECGSVACVFYGYYEFIADQPHELCVTTDNCTCHAHYYSASYSCRSCYHNFSAAVKYYWSHDTVTCTGPYGWQFICYQ